MKQFSNSPQLNFKTFIYTPIHIDEILILKKKLNIKFCLLLLKKYNMKKYNKDIIKVHNIHSTL